MECHRGFERCSHEDPFQESKLRTELIGKHLQCQGLKKILSSNIKQKQKHTIGALQILVRNFRGFQFTVAPPKLNDWLVNRDRYNGFL